MSLSELIGPTINKSQIISDTANKTSEAGYNNYVALVAGFNVIDGSSSHPIVMKTNTSATGFSSLYFESQDHTLYDMSPGITGGKIGAILELRGKAIDPATGIPDDGKLQKFIDQIDALATGLIENTNNIYAQSATQAMRSQSSTVNGSTVLAQSPLSIKDGSFDVALYDATGKEVGRKTISVNTQNMTIDDIMKQITASKDDTKDNNSTNDIDDFLDAGYVYDNGSGVAELKIKDEKKATGYTFALIDNGSNVPGAFGLGRFFDGKSGKDIQLRSDLYSNPVDINAYSNPVNGNNVVANAMQQFQFNKFTITTRMGQSSDETISGYYRAMVSSIASDTAAAQQTNTTFSAIVTTSQQVFQSTTKVNLDEELTNLMRFQTGYSANSKVITTIDQMMNTLLGIKQ
jgi:flagellar hook-associated protein 1 FlgK